MDKISVVVPCYNEEESLPLFYEEICKISEQMPEQNFEFLFIDDGSKDNTLAELEALAEKDKRVKYISFSRNFGKESGIYAGLKNAKGDYVVLIDADLQHPPRFIIDMYNGIVSEGYDSVAARRVNRDNEPVIRSFFSRMFYKIINRISDTTMESGVTDYRMMNRSMVDAVLSLCEYNRFTKGLFSWVGFKTKWIPYKNVERVAGETTWSFFSLFKYSMQGIFNFSTAPLAAASMLGIIFCVFSFLMIAVIVLKTLLLGEPVAGFPTLICAMFFIGGIQLLCVGILGQYLAKMFMEVKKRPIYLTRKTNLGENSNDD